MTVQQRFASTALLALLLVGCASTETRRAYAAGIQDAKNDIAAGSLAIETLGWPPPWDQEYALLLHRRYNIHVRRVGHCVVAEETEAHARGYNQVAEKEIERRFGDNVLQDATTEARKLHASKGPTR